MKILSIDIGGMSIKYSVLEEVTNDVDISVKTIRNSNKNHVLKLLEDICKDHQEMVDGISISAPGAIINNSFIAGRNGIENFWNFNLVHELNSRGINCNILVINDANAAIYAEYTLGSGNGFHNIAMITIGTGIGGGLIINDKLVTGKNGLAAEFGYMTTYSHDKDSKRFVWGSDSGAFRALESKFEKETGEFLEGKEIFALHHSGNKQASEIINYFYGGISYVLWNITFAFNPERIIIGGGLSNNEIAMKELDSTFKKMLADNEVSNDNLYQIVPAKFKNKAGIIGAYCFYIDRERRGR